MIRADQRNHRVVAKQLDRVGFNGTFMVGDVVKLNIEFATQNEMTIESISGTKASVTWFVGSALHRNTFALDKLVFVRR